MTCASAWSLKIWIALALYMTPPKRRQERILYDMIDFLLPVLVQRLRRWEPGQLFMCGRQVKRHGGLPSVHCYSFLWKSGVG